MDFLSLAQAYAPWMQQLRRDFHKHPEIGFEEFRTSDVIAHELAKMGFAVFRGIGGTGLVATLPGQMDGLRIGLRADMDALPMD